MQACTISSKSLPRIFQPFCHLCCSLEFFNHQCSSSFRNYNSCLMNAMLLRLFLLGYFARKKACALFPLLHAVCCWLENNCLSYLPDAFKMTNYLICSTCVCKCILLQDDYAAFITFAKSLNTL